MTTFKDELNNFLVETFNTILSVEEEIIQHNNNIPLTISELHLIEAVGKCGQKNTISDIAAMLDITLASVTVGVNKLINKGFLTKERNINDKRSVHISLSETGREMNEYHTYFHQKMIEGIEDELTDDEKAILLISIKRLDKFFKAMPQKYRDGL